MVGYIISFHRDFNQRRYAHTPQNTKPPTTGQLLNGTAITCHRLVLCWDRPRILTAARGYTPPGGAVSSVAANRDPTGKEATRQVDSETN